MALAAERTLVLRLKEKREGNAMSQAARDLDELANRVDVTGDHTTGLTRDIKTLNAEIEKSVLRIKELGRQFAASGDTSLLGDIRKERSKVNQLKRIVEDLGKAASPSFADGLMSKLEGAPLRNQAIALGVALGVGAAPALAGAISAAVLGAVGAGGVIGGADLALQNPVVERAWMELGQGLEESLKDSASSFVGPMIQAAYDLRGNFDRAGFTGIFEQASKLVKPLGDSLGGFVEKLGPGLERAMEGALPVLNQLAIDLPDFGDSV